MIASSCILYAEVVEHVGIKNILALQANAKMIIERIIGNAKGMRTLIRNNIRCIEIRFSPQPEKAIGFAILRKIIEVIFPNEAEIPVCLQFVVLAKHPGPQRIQS